MRWTLVVAAGCLICLGLPGHADWFTVKVSKPHGTWSAYLDDNSACIGASRFPSHRGAASGSTVHIQKQAERTASSNKYWRCMVAKGYRADPHGYRARAIYYSRVAPRYTQPPE